MAKFVCPVCGYVYEGDAAPEKCPQCGVPGSKFIKKEEADAGINFATVHSIGDGKVDDQQIMDGLHANFTGECTEVGMYLAMSRQAEREGYPEIADAFKRYAFEEAEHAAKFALMQKLAPALASLNWLSAPRNSDSTPFTTPFTKWQRTKLVTEPDSPDCSRDSLKNKILNLPSK